MRRIRVALLLVSAATLGLVALLAWRAQQGLLAERAVRHEAVAERAFEEMERALGDVLQREEGRPFEDYAFYLPTSGERSPLAAGLEPFVVGAFQLDPQGAVTTPLEPPDPDAARARGDWPASDAVHVAIARVRRVVNELWSANDTDASDEKDDLALASRLGKLQQKSAREAEAPGSQAPGTTRAISGPGLGSRQDRAGAEPAEKREARNAFDLLESLNRSADYRAERKQKVAQAPSAAVYGASEGASGAQAPPPPAPRPGRLPLDEPADIEAEISADLADELQETLLAIRPRELDALGEVRRNEAALRLRRRAPVRIAIDPMVGVAAGPALVLYRTVLVGEQGYRQGLVLDRAALGAWLEERVIRASGLEPVASLRFGRGAPSEPGGRYVFAHRFAEPFDALEAELALAALPGVASPGALYALVAVLLAVGAAGLVAVHRTAAVTVQYAERRSNFVAAVTHELKTPLTAIRMYAEMLRDGLVASEPKRQEYYDTITDESERLSRLVDNVLEFSKLEGGRRELAIAAGPVEPVLAEAVEKLATHAARAGFELRIAAAPDLPAVRFDRDALLQVLFNLVDNAMKYASDSERPVIELEARRQGDAVAVAVRDFGPGVTRQHMERVFEPFYRGESELTRTTKGTGIGLALVKELGERMGAAVSGANAEGGGFRVQLLFPGVESAGA